MIYNLGKKTLKAIKLRQAHRSRNFILMAEWLFHPAYSLDLSPPDFELKKHLVNSVFCCWKSCKEN